MSNVAVILGAGSGTRMKADKSKLLLDINGKTVLERTVAAFSSINEIDEIIVVCRENDLNAFEDVLNSYDVSYCFGGSTRQKSVSNAVETIYDADLLIVHDGARPLVTEKEIIDTLNQAQKYGAAAVGVPVKDTIKIVDRNFKIVDTPDRETLISIRTPQIFDFEMYKKALNLACEQGEDFTDDCRLFENAGYSVYVVKGEYSNIKITTPEDIPMAESILKMRGEE
ncbi:MAG: 2-C-methyl-D-erythritol 4-phosphate cytidylyltransferase [Acetobacter sp.]|nr:2-C-methyl-D-erythritol 4-phosphate cytidylyltransferase [Bacteroides sp.]MCM1342080.1 2-C-methyl-D-erythritol 4-phosphate cytidylyltransferase [Acetobacter sp.]MCM1434311.1 2-C-methyl-D-erythritol 4-phosphate cytidylyltransferase [Clostridiales bacterium]